MLYFLSFPDKLTKHSHLCTCLTSLLTSGWTPLTQLSPRPHYPEELENETITGHFGFVFEEIWSGKSHDYHDVIVFEKLLFQNVFCPNENEKPAF